MNVKIIRDTYNSQATLGKLIIGDVVLHTLEEPWRMNQVGISCIPKGVYKCVPHNWSGNARLKFNKVWQITNVPNRTSILIHAGNTTDDIEGCVLVGLTRGFIGKKPAVLNSRLAVAKLRDIIGNRGFTLTIEDE